MATRLCLEIYSHVNAFRKYFQLVNTTSDYLYFKGAKRYSNATVAIYRTSCKCYRVMYYSSRLAIDCKSEYKSFRSIQDMCVWLDTIARAL